MAQRECSELGRKHFEIALRKIWWQWRKMERMFQLKCGMIRHRYKENVIRDKSIRIERELGLVQFILFFNKATSLSNHTI